MVNVGCFLDLRPIAEAILLNEMLFDCFASLKSLDDDVLSPHHAREFSDLADTAEDIGSREILMWNEWKKEEPWKPTFLFVVRFQNRQTRFSQFFSCRSQATIPLQPIYYLLSLNEHRLLGL